MPWIDPWGNLYDELPERIRLADHTTRTAQDATPIAALEGGWRLETPPDLPAVDTMTGA